MTSAQASGDVGSTIEPMSSMPIFKRLYFVIYKLLALTFSVLITECSELLSRKNPGGFRHVFLSKSTRFESTDFASVMIEAAAGVISTPNLRCDSSSDKRKHNNEINFIRWYNNRFCESFITRTQLHVSYLNDWQLQIYWLSFINTYVFTGYARIPKPSGTSTMALSDKQIQLWRSDRKRKTTYTIEI